MKNLITGAAGFIGTNLSNFLLNNNEEVIGVDNFITGSKKNIDFLSKHPNFHFYNSSINDPNFINKLKSKKIDRIYHLACPTGVDNLKKIPMEMLLTSSDGTKHILDLALHFQAKLLFTSSSEVYGNPVVFPQSETYTGNVTSIGIRSPYEEGKRFSESLIASYIRTNQLNACIVRVFNTYGPYAATTDSRAIPHFFKKALTNEPISIYGDGSQKRTFLYIKDLLDGIILVMEKAKPFDIFNIGSNVEVSIKDLANQILELTNSKSTINYLKRPLHDCERRLPALDKIKALKWHENYSLKKGLSETFKIITAACGHVES